MKFNNKNLGIGGIRYLKYKNSLEEKEIFIGHNTDTKNSNLQINKSIFTPQIKIIKYVKLAGNIINYRRHIIAPVNNIVQININEPVCGSFGGQFGFMGDGYVTIYWKDSNSILHREHLIQFPPLQARFSFILYINSTKYNTLIIKGDTNLYVHSVSLYYNVDVENSNFHFTAPVNIT